jgi:hypothetical protein
MKTFHPSSLVRVAASRCAKKRARDITLLEEGKMPSCSIASCIPIAIMRRFTLRHGGQRREVYLCRDGTVKYSPWIKQSFV